MNLPCKNITMQLGSTLMALMVGVSIGLMVILATSNLLHIINTQQVKLAQQIEDTSAVRQAYRRIQHVAVHAGQHIVEFEEKGLLRLQAPTLSTPTPNRAELALATTDTASPQAADCLDRHATTAGFLYSVFYVGNGSLRCNVADRSGGQPVVDGFSAMSVQWFVATAQGIQVQTSIQPARDVLGHASCLTASSGTPPCATAIHHHAVSWVPTALTNAAAPQ